MRPGSARRATAGLTLIELLVVLVIIAMVAAIAWPNVAGVWRERSFDVSMDLTASALSNARMDAIRRGEAVRASIEVRASGAVVMVLSGGEVAPVSGGDGLVPASLDDLSSEPDEVEVWRRVVRLGLPRCCRIVDPALEPDADDPFGGAFGGGVEAPMAAEPEPLELATFFPDGSAMSVGRLALVDERGRRAWIEVGAVSGRVRLVRDDPPADGAPGDADGDGLGVPAGVEDLGEAGGGES